MKSFALERLDSEIFEEKSKHTKFGKTKYLEYDNILLDNFRFAFGRISERNSKIDTLHLISETARNFDESDLEEIDLLEDKKFYKVDYRNSKLTQIAKIIAIDNDICFKIREKKFILNRTIRMEIKNESKWKTYI